MLGKLIKYEWKRMWKLPTVIIIFINIMAVFFGKMLMNEYLFINSVMTRIVWVTIFILFAAGILAATIGVFFYFAIGFYKSTYSDEGYLLHTLPVTTRKILVSKIAVITIWQFLIALGILSAIFSATIVIGLTDGLEIEGLIEGIHNIREELTYLFREEGLSFPRYFIVILLSGIIRGIFIGTFITASISIGQLARKNRIGGAISAGGILFLILATINNIISSPSLAVNILVGENYSVILKILESELIILMLYTAVLYCISEYIMSKKLNLE